MVRVHTIQIDFADLDAAERAFERLEHMLWIMEEGGMLSLTTVTEPDPINSNTRPKR